MASRGAGVRSIVCLAIVCLVAPFSLRARQAQPTFRAGVNLVVLDVSVLDKNRQPVHGLTPSDFTVRQGGAVQRIEVFSEVTLPGPEATGTGWLAKAPPADVETNGGDSQRVIAIVLDDAMTPQDPLFVRQAKLVATEVINRMGPHDVAAVVFTRDNHHAQSFTSDHAKLFAAVETFNGGMSFTVGPNPPAPVIGTIRDPPEPTIELDFPLYVASERTLGDIANTLISLPDKRKMLVYVGLGVGANARATNAPALAGPGSTRSSRPGTLNVSVPVHEEQIQVQDDLNDILNQARHANVNIYSFDPGGLNGLENFCSGHPGGCIPLGGESIQDFYQTFHDYVTTVATSTDGRPSFSNDPTPAIDQMFAENGSYYLLGYRETNPPKAGDAKPVEVKVSRKGLDVRARNQTYAAWTANARAAKNGQPPPPPALAAIANVLPEASVPLRLNVIPFARPDGHGTTLAVIVGVREPALPSTSNEPVKKTLELVMRAFTLEGAPRGESAATADVTLGPMARSGDGDLRYDVAGRLDVPAGAAHEVVRVGVTDRSTGTTGSVYADVDIPDFSAPIAFSGVAFDASAGLGGARADVLRDVLPAAATTSRDFASSMHVTAAVRLYARASELRAPVTVNVTLRNGADAVVFTQPFAFDPNRFAATGAVDLAVSLPLTNLAAGPYLVAFDADGGDRHARQAVAIHVSK